MPAKSKDQAIAARIALAVAKGKLPKSKLKGASRQMYNSLNQRQLEEFAREK